EEALAAAYDLDGAFSDVSLLLMRGANEDAVIDDLDLILERYGGTGAYGREDQTSHAFLDAELTQLEAMSRILPPIFLIVAAFLVNMTMNRLIALEREQIGLLKALGYTGAGIALHYLLFVAAISAVGVVIGFFAGTWLGAGMTRLYASFFHFPFLIFDRDPGTYALAGLTTLAAALLGALKAVLGASRLAPAVAMRPPAPPRFQQGLTENIGLFNGMGQLGIMVVRQLARYPGRAAMTISGMAMSVAILVGTIWPMDAVDFMIDVTYFQADRQDASINFAGERDYRAVFAAARLPGVMRAEPYRVLSARLSNGPRERRVAITGKPPDATLSRVLNVDLDPIALPETGLTLSEALARLLDVERGDLVEIELLEGRRRIVSAPVTEIVQGYLGLSAFMNIEALNELNFEGPVVSGVHLAIDPAENDALMAELKETPAARFIALQKVSLQKFQETLAQTMLIGISVYMILAGIIAFGVVYNAARISLSERGRELASLCVLGFTRAEVSRVLLIELAVLTIVAQPIGWVIGYGMAKGLALGFESDLYRMPFVVAPHTYAIASLVVVVAALVSAMMVQSRVNQLDMIEVLKTRE
ncbi:MAG: FtsX-like permease family protein, partial [Pseudomonadota bacterium]